MNLKQSARMMMLLALFGFAVFWIFVMGLLTVMVGARPTSKPRDDESVKATFTNLDRDKDFNITALVNVTDKDGKVLTNLGERDFDVFENGQLVTQFKQFAGRPGPGAAGPGHGLHHDHARQDRPRQDRRPCLAADDARSIRLLRPLLLQRHPED